MSRKGLGVLIFLLVVSGSLLIVFLMRDKNQESMKDKAQEQNKVCFQNFCFEVEIAKTLEQRRQGLMFRQSLDQDKGMLFDFGEQGKHSFWMKNMLIPLDIIWLNENNEVVFIRKNAQPCLEGKCESIMADKPARYVLEINAGLADKIGLGLASQFIFSFSD